MKKVFKVSAVIIMTIVLLVSCGKKADDVLTVGICQLVQHDALDAATQGFKDALTAEFGDKVVFDEQNASGEMNNCSTIVNGFVSKNVNLILANATPALQAAASATSDIPILGTAVTHYGTALEIDNWTGTVGKNISGTSDLAPLDQQAQIVKDWFPQAKTVGLIFCSAEANSVFQVEEMEKNFAALGLKTVRFSFTDSNDIASVTQKACDSCDVIYIPTDNTAASNAEAIANIVVPAKVPVIAGEGNLCAACGIATLSISYYDLGVTTGKMAAKILKGEAKAGEMPIEYTNATKQFNEELCKAYGLTPVNGYEPIK